MGVPVLYNRDWRPYLDLQAKFLLNLSMQTLNQSFSRLLFASGKFPQTTQHSFEGTLGDQHFAVVTDNGASPCGTCRQVMMEFSPQMTVIIADTQGNARQTSIGDLLPDGFTPDQLPRQVDSSQ